MAQLFILLLLLPPYLTSLLFFFTITATATPTSYGNFSHSCTSIQLTNNFFLRASCFHPPDENSNVTASNANDNKLDLAMCIGLDQVTGRMEWQAYGKFSNYCRNCTISVAGNRNPNPNAETEAEAEAEGEEHILTCSCATLTGRRGPIQSTLNLDEGITNDMGTLECSGGMAALVYEAGRK